jgi:hypothetical protein
MSDSRAWTDREDRSSNIATTTGSIKFEANGLHGIGPVRMDLDPKDFPSHLLEQLQGHLRQNNASGPSNALLASSNIVAQS